MTHRHEWHIFYSMLGDGQCVGSCSIPFCEKVIKSDEIERRLNATEYLSAEDADKIAKFADGVTFLYDEYIDLLQDYARRLEDETE